MNEWIFGIDGGGTSSRIRVEELTDGRKPLYEARGGSTNPNCIEAKVVADVLRGLVEGALASGLEPAGCKAGFIGSAGVDRPEDRVTMAAALRTAFKEAGRRTDGPLPALAAGNDAEPALVGAVGDVEGFLLIAGTGSIALGRTRSGESVRSGGWGHFLGDEGSAFWIAFEAIKRGIRSRELRDKPSALLEAAIEHFGLPDELAFFPFTYQNFSKSGIASFAPRVAALAEGGDELALSIMDSAATELAALAASVYKRLAPRVTNRRLALYGGLLERNRPLNSAVSSRIAAAFPEIVVIEPAGDAQAGACRLARELLN
ncbi:MAG: hypothetical protein CVV47_02485 [Spirochaetae bacterium HGW-Spirochaetae-3]|jgi:N-acetylglucosamine kinase-like BadF-type ATPase|nr:MAG: hypothetical protein CVV47_02485 [Spirochaetae bacterium HGW-Spirochaetae-3]